MTANSWMCPKCGAKLIGRNMWHACRDYSVEAILAGKGPDARALFDRMAELIAQWGPYTVAPAKTRIAFMALVRFASITRIGRNG